MSLLCLIDPDLLPWERASVHTIAQSLSQRVAVEIRELGVDTHKILRGSRPADVVWLAAADYDHAIKSVGGRGYRYPLFVSIFGRAPRPSVLTVLWKNRASWLPGHIQLVTHCPFSYRFYREVGNVPESQLHVLPLPVMEVKKNPVPVRDANLVVGTFTYFAQEKNIPFFVSVAHAVLQKRPQTKFRLMGTGPLFSHYQNLIASLNLEKQIHIESSVNLSQIQELDLFLYVPLHNRHFICPVQAAASGVAVLSHQLPGIEDCFRGVRENFIYPVHDTKAMAERIVKLSDHREELGTLAGSVKASVSNYLAPNVVVEEYENLFFDKKKSVRVAA